MDRAAGQPGAGAEGTDGPRACSLVRVGNTGGHVPAVAAGAMSLAEAGCLSDPATARAEPSLLLPAPAAGNICCGKLAKSMRGGIQRTPAVPTLQPLPAAPVSAQLWHAVAQSAPGPSLHLENRLRGARCHCPGPAQRGQAVALQCWQQCSQRDVCRRWASSSSSPSLALSQVRAAVFPGASPVVRATWTVT